MKFSVRSDSYSMGASIRVRWIDGPAAAAVEQIAKTFAGAEFDSSTDYKGGREHRLNGQLVHFGADYVFCDQDISPGRKTLTDAAMRQLDERQLNNLEAAIGLGRLAHCGARPVEVGDSDWPFFVQQVARATLPAVLVRPSPTASAVTFVRSY